MAFRLITDVRGNEYFVNADCIALLEPFARGGWASGAVVRMKQGVVSSPTTIDVNPDEGRAIRLWLEQL